jgi:ergothioneine biosynthesis protein EgtB
MLTSNPFSKSSQGHGISAPDAASLRNTFRTAYQQCRQSTLALICQIDSTLLCRQAHPDFSPIGWHVGHIAYTEALWILERLARQASMFPHYHRLFAADGLPKAERQNLPDLETLYDYLGQVRQAVFSYLDTAPVIDQQRIWWFLLQHESQHCETIALVYELFRMTEPSLVETSTPPSTSVQDAVYCAGQRGMCHVPKGSVRLGNDAYDALDNEQPSYETDIDDFWIDPYPVTCHEFQQFIDAGGYQTAHWWLPEAWAWVQEHRICQPLYWSNDARRSNHPVCGVSWYEASAYAKFVGKRLPTEAEWEKAARWNPSTKESTVYPWGNDHPTQQKCNHAHTVGTTTEVTDYPSGASPVGCIDLMGNVWEWTSSLFEPYEGFKPFPYVGYSQTYFDNQHYVLKGGSWATRPWALRPALRNWYHPWVRQIFSGIRCASSVPPYS